MADGREQWSRFRSPEIGLQAARFNAGQPLDLVAGILVQEVSHHRLRSGDALRIQHLLSNEGTTVVGAQAGQDYGDTLPHDQTSLCPRAFLLTTNGSSAVLEESSKAALPITIVRVETRA